MSALLTKRRTSAEPPARRISGPVDGSFQHVNSAITNTASPVSYSTPIPSTSASAPPSPAEAVKTNRHSKIARRLTKTFSAPFLLSSSSPEPVSSVRISDPVPGSFTTLTSSPVPIPSAASSPLVFPSRPRQDRACRATYCAPSSAAVSIPEAMPMGYTPHSKRHQSVSFPKLGASPPRAQVIISESAATYTLGSPSFAAYAPLSGDTTPALGSHTPRTPGGGPKRIARKPVPAAGLAEVDFGAVPRLSLSYTSNTAEKRKSTAEELEGGLFAPSPAKLRVEVAAPAPEPAAEEVTPTEGLAARLFAGWGGRRSPTIPSPTSSPLLAVPMARPYPLGESPALPPLPVTPSLSEELDSATACERARHCPSPAQSSCSAYSSASSSISEVLTVPRLSTGSDTTTASAASSCTCPVTGSWQWGNPQSPPTPLSPSPYDPAAYRLGTPSMEDSRGKNAKRSSVWMPTRVQSGGKMFQLSPVLGSLSPTIAEEAWGQGAKVEQWSGDVLEITLSR